MTVIEKPVMNEVAKIRIFRSLLTLITDQSCITLQTRPVG
jgi:hypothetical protein